MVDHHERQKQKRTSEPGLLSELGHQKDETSIPINEKPRSQRTSIERRKSSLAKKLSALSSIVCHRRRRSRSGSSIKTGDGVAISLNSLQHPSRRHCFIGTALVLLGLLCALAASSLGQTITTSPSTIDSNAPSATSTTIATTTTSASTDAASTTSESSMIVDIETKATTTPAPETIDGGATAAAAAGKLKPVNFTLVDELFAEAINDEDRLLKKWRHMDVQIQDGIRSILKLIFPQIVAVSQDAKVSGDCSGGILKWILSLRNLRSWAIKMLDATGKPTSGIFQGSLTMMGNYGQCLSVRAPDEDEIEITDHFEEYFRGQYCVVHLRPHLPPKRPFYHLNSTIDSLLRKNYKYYEKTLYDELAEIAIAFQFVDIRLDLCVPSTCTKADIQRVAELLSMKLEFRAKVMRCDIEARDSSAGLGWALANNQQIQYWLILPTLLLAATVTATLALLTKVIDHKSSSSNGLSSLIHSLTLQASFSHLVSTLRPNSSRERKHMTNDEQEQTIPECYNREKPLPLYGLRSVFVVWFMIVQMTVQLKYQYLRESLILRNMLLDYWPFQIIINTSMIYESFILITAFTYGYCNLESPIKNLFKYTLRKYIRIVPSMVTLVAVTLLTPVLPIASPVWKNFVDEQAEICKSTGYLNLFFLQNFISYEKICIPHSWMLCVELQLIVISIPLLALLRKPFRNIEDSVIIARSEKSSHKASDRRSSRLVSDTLKQLLKSQAGSLCIVFVVLGAGINFFNVYTNQLPPTWFNSFPDPEQKSYYFGAHLAKTWAHLSAFVIGLIGGHLCRTVVKLRLAENSTTINMETHDSSNINPTEPQGTSEHSSSIGNNLSISVSTSTIAEESPTSSRGLFVSVPPETTQEYVSQDCYKHSCIVQVSALVCMMAIIFSTYSWSTQQLPSPLVSGLYDSLSRIVWSLALVGLIVRLCLPQTPKGNSTGVARFLSCKIFIVLGRLSLLAYLWAPYVHSFVLAAQQQALFPSLFLIFHVIVGNIVITYAISLIMSITIEQPIRLAIDNHVISK